MIEYMTVLGQPQEYVMFLCHTAAELHLSQENVIPHICSITEENFVI